MMCGINHSRAVRPPSLGSGITYVVVNFALVDKERIFCGSGRTAIHRIASINLFTKKKKGDCSEF